MVDLLNEYVAGAEGGRSWTREVLQAWTSGTVVAICGIDGSGKSTLIEGLAKRLREEGRSVVQTRQPTDFYRNLAPVRAYHDHGADAVPAEVLALLSAADRALHLEHEVLPALMEGRTVLSDRFLPAARAIFATRDLDVAWIDEINSFCPNPHGQVLLDLRGEEAVRRIEARGGYIRLEERSPTILEAIADRYRRQVLDHALVLDATAPAHELVERAAAYVLGLGD